MQAKASGRDGVLGLYRRNRIDDAALDRQLDQIGAEERLLKEREAAMETQLSANADKKRRVRTAPDLLAAILSGWLSDQSLGARRVPAAGSVW